MRWSILCQRFIVVLAFLSISVAANAAPAANSRHQGAPAFESWMTGTSYLQPSLAPSSPDNWLGGTGNWSNPAGWSAGEPGSNSDVFINTGNDNVTLDVNASINSLTLGGSSGSSMLTNSGNSTLTIAGALTINQTGTLTMFGVNVGGTLTNQGVASAQVLSVGGNLINQATGTIEGLMPGSTMNVTGELTNHGTIDSRYGSAVFGSLNNPGGGSIRSGADTIHGNVSSDGNILVVSLGENEPPVSFAIGGNLITSGLLDVAGSGRAGASASVAGSITNTPSGLIEVDTLSSLDGASITNSGTITTGVQGISPGGNTVQANTLSNLAGGTILLGGMGDTATFGSVTNAGSISIANGATLTVPPSSHATGNVFSGFLNSGTVQIASGGTLSSLNKYTQTAGQTTIDGTLRGPSNFAGGAVYGNGGTIQGSVTSNAAFNMGDMPMTVGTMMINGNYTQGANGSLAFDIASLTSFDQLNVSGHASLNGTLFVDLLNGYTPQIGNMFDIMNFASKSGTFSMTLGLPINSNEHFVLEYSPTNLTLDVVAGPDNLPTSGRANGNVYYYEPYVSDVMQGANLADVSGATPSSSVPEPGSIVLFASGILGIVALRRRAS